MGSILLIMIIFVIASIILKRISGINTLFIYALLTSSIVSTQISAEIPPGLQCKLIGIQKVKAFKAKAKHNKSIKLNNAQRKKMKKVLRSDVKKNDNYAHPKFM